MFPLIINPLMKPCPAGSEAAGYLGRGQMVIAIEIVIAIVIVIV